MVAAQVPRGARGPMEEHLEPTAAKPDGGLIALVMMLRFQGLSIDPERIRHQFGHKLIGVAEMLRCAKDLGLKARIVRSSWVRLSKVPMPALALLKDGQFLLLGKVEPERVIVLQPGRSQPTMMTPSELTTVWDGPLLLMTKRATLSDLARRFDLTWFIAAIYKYRWLLSEVLLASFFLQLFALVSPLFFQVVVDKVLVHRSMSTLDVLAIGLIAIALFETVLSILRTYLLSHTTNRIDVELGARLFRHLLALPIGYFQTRRVGDSVARVRELENIRTFLTSSSLTVAIDLFFTIIFIGVLFVYSPLLTWIVVAAFPIYVVISAVATPLFQYRLDEKFRRGAENQAFLVESVTAIETLKAMAVEPQMQRRWEEQLAAYVSASFRVLSLGNFTSQFIQFISKIVSALILYFGAKLVISGDLTVGELVAFNLLAGRVNAPILRLAQLWQDFQQTRLSVARLGDILNTAPEPAYMPSRMSLAAIRGDVRFEHVTFRYRIDGPEILYNINIHCPAGQVIGVVGPSGSGKSTLAKLVQRLYVPETGRVLVDGVDIAQVDPSWLRRQIGVVLQDSVLLNASIRENIALVDPATPAGKVLEAAALAGAHDFIIELPEGYDTVVGERGNTLSGGQRQRVAIARALITDPRILIFDEATSALDYESERIVQKNMAQIAKGRTVFIIAHRLSALRMADRIITIENGRLVEDGTHQELIKAGGRYAKLYRLQAGFHDPA
jgi:subfamily B ATP-binding cassette protein HlyB/CyaB